MAEKRDSGQAGMTTWGITRVLSFPLVGSTTRRESFFKTYYTTRN
ncbi:MAG TPA: hypothetical protein VJ000_01435 [Thermodesulfovibrionia bacterium]|nr:hypothetical protein [Thermodesulfovibrionia bacterium]